MDNSNRGGHNKTSQSSSNIKLISIVYELLNFVRLTFGRLIPLTVFALVIWTIDAQYQGIRQVTLSYVNIVEKAQILIIALIGLRLIELGMEKFAGFSLPNEVRIQYTTLSLIATLVAMYLFVDLNQTLAVNTAYNGARMSIVSSFLTVIVVVYLITSLVLSWLRGKLSKHIDETMLVSANSIKYYKVGFSKIGVFK
jgi:hypothetical protein